MSIFGNPSTSSSIRISFGVILLLSCIGCSSLTMTGQEYVADCELLGERLEKELSTYNGEESKRLKKSLKPLLCAPELRSTQLDSIALFCNTFQDKRISLSKGFLDYLHALEELLNRQNPELWHSWHTVVDTLIQNKKWKRNVASFLKVSPALIREQVLYSSSNVKWRIEDAAFELRVDSIPKLIFENARLIGVSKNDRIEVERTDGKWDLTSDRIQFAGGKLPWVGTQFDSLGYYAQLGAFELKLSSNGFTCQNATWHSDLISEPLRGKVTTKLQNVKDEESKTYPRFRSAAEVIRLDGLFENIVYEGGMAVKGSNISGIGTPELLARVEVFRNDSLFMSFHSKEFLFSPRGFSSTHSKMNLFFRSDTIRHPDVRVRLDDGANILRIIRQTEGLGQQVFTDNYHAISWDVDGFIWNRNETKILIGSVFGGSSKLGVFESDRYFKREAFLRMKGIGDVHPLTRVKGFVKENNRSEFSSEDYARFIKMSEVQARAELLNLANAGFVHFDPESRWCEVQPKLFSNMRNFSGRQDYDVLQWQSSPKSGENAEWSLLNGFMSIYGVDYVFLSDSQDVKIIPRDGEVVLSENKDFTFHGRLLAGNLDLIGEGFVFDYDAFTIELNQIEGVRMSVNDFNNLDARGFPTKRRVRSVLSEVSGKLSIDHPNNRSGIWSANHEEYPIFTSIDPSFVYFDQPELYSGAYKRDDFYYAVDPFVLNGLDDLTAESLSFKGTLVSAGILKDLYQPLKVMDDMHLGLITTTPEAGQSVYNSSVARFSEGVTLDGKGLQGAGKIDFLTAIARSERLTFLPDSIIGDIEWLKNERSSKSNVPILENQGGYLVFRPNDEELEVRSGSEPLKLFAEDVFLDGHSVLSKRGLQGSGQIRFSDATLTSSDFDFEERQILSDSSSFKVSGRPGGIAAFETNDVRAIIDFDNRIGDFMPNSGETKIELPIQQYVCYMDRFRWFMDRDEVGLISDRRQDSLPMNFSRNRSYTNFLSVHPEQDSLHFFSSSATYQIKEDFLRCEDVEEIAVGDALIYPDSGKIIIRDRARMDELSNAGIVANGEARWHRIDNANLKINGRLSFVGDGMYRYRNKNGDTTQVYMNNIYLDDSYQTVAIGNVMARDAVELSPAFAFAGNVKMTSAEPHLWFQGGAKLLKPCDQFLTTWISFESFLDPLAIAIPVSESVSDHDGDRLGYGLMASTRAPFTIQSGFLDPMSEEDNVPLMPIEGSLRFADGHYVISTRAKFEDKSTLGNRIDLDVVQCTMSGSGDLALPLEFNLVSHNFSGEFYQDLLKNQHLKGSFQLDFHFEDDLFERMSEQIQSWVSSEPLVMSDSNYEQAFTSWLGEEKSMKFLDEITLTGKIKNIPKQLKHSLTFSEVDFVWDEDEEMFVSDGKLGIMTMGKYPVFMEVPGKIELIRSRSGDAFRVYLHGDERNWYYLEYKLGKLSVSSPDLTLLTMISDIKRDKKQLKGDNGSRYLYQYMRSTARRNDLVDNYRDFD